MYKLVCIDMDGTLLRDDKTISQYTIETLKKASEKGVKIVICTGRLFTSAYYYADIIGIKAPIISANGAYIREKDRDEIIYEATLGIENCRRILKILNKYNLTPNFHSPEAIFTGDINSNYFKLYSMNGSQGRIVEVKHWEEIFIKHESEILKCITQDEDLEKIKKAKEEMLSEIGLSVVSSHSNNFEVMVEGISKGRAVEILAKFYNINKDEIICIGDNENDMSMLEVAGLAIAMGNGTDEVKKISRYITATNNEDGVAKAIEKFVL